MKKWNFFIFLVAALSLMASSREGYKPDTYREPPQYLSSNPALVEDTCPEHDILNRFSCGSKNPPGYRCFDVYLVQGDPIAKDRYTLLEEKISREASTADPRCPFENLTCENFLEYLQYDLSFSWFIDNFPSSSFSECQETYSCTRIACLKPISANPNSEEAKKLSCVFKKNKRYFLGNQILCQNKNNDVKP